MSPVSRSGWYGLSFLVLAVLAADQISKYAVDKLTYAGSLRVIIPGLLNLTHTSNPGVAFGLLADSRSPWLASLLIAFSAAVIALLVWLLATDRAGGWLGKCGLGMILGGAAGNVLDRVLRRSVTDFIDFHVGSFHWYTFNLADSAIVIGAGLVILELFRDWRHPRGEQERA
ncbi:MAG TPA: signal peptidase II [Candidatus Limnocylindria bacterium]|nr:signal peptidase II [Candidatus Limnocylindria bacterium]